ncbi:hypothetical protein FDP25_11100 [Roseovarius sp. A21]|uniref:Uncharacterized protein n=1 Tax=Roseovarius bejariae TaxID=2576383 RepID=A0A844D168_9RHOB|nr:hypothetical protein [Roseovarius bejariae]MRU15974.1 hypothetical protein [Roseovarius bejariae]
MPPVSRLGGHTLIAATAESGAVWSVYLGKNGEAEFTYANGTRNSVPWRRADRDVLCFRFEAGAKEVCKGAKQYGIGRGWATVARAGDGWRLVGDDPLGSSRLLTARKGRMPHDPTSWKGDLRESLPGRLYFDVGEITALEVRPDGMGAYITTGSDFEAEASVDSHAVCLGRECLDVSIEKGRLVLRERGDPEPEGVLLYLAKGQFETPRNRGDNEDSPAPQVSQVPDEAPEPDPKQEMPRFTLAPSEDYTLVLSDSVNVAAAAHYSQPGFTMPLAIVPDPRGGVQLHVDGKPLTDQFRPEAAKIVITTDGGALIWFRMAHPEGECDSWLRWVVADKGGKDARLSDMFNVCGEAVDLEVRNVPFGIAVLNTARSDSDLYTLPKMPTAALWSTVASPLRIKGENTFGTFHGTIVTRPETEYRTGAPVMHQMSAEEIEAERKKNAPPPPEVDYPWVGWSADVTPIKPRLWERLEDTEVDFKDGAPRIGGKVLVPGFAPDSARIVAVTEAYVLIRFSGPMLPKGCEEAYRWLWVTGPNYGRLSKAFGACTATDEVEVTWDGARIDATLTPESGVPSTFRIFPGRNDTSRALSVSVQSGPSVEIPLPEEEDWKGIERRAAEERRQAEEAEAKRAREEKKRQRAEAIAARRQPASPTGALDGGNFFDILALEPVQSAIRAEDNGADILELFDSSFDTVTRLPENRRVQDVYIGVTCGPDGCRELLSVLFYDSRAKTALGFLFAGFGAVPFGNAHTLDKALLDAEIERAMGYLKEE